MAAKEPVTTGKVLVFDLETSDLSANRGFIICASAKWVGQRRIHKWMIGDTPGYGETPRSYYDDSAIVSALVALCNSAEAVVAHYGRKFDVPYLNTRAVASGLRPTAPLTVIDPWDTARKELRLARNDLGSVAAVLNCTAEKYHLPWKDWHHAKFGDMQAQRKLLRYCVNDIYTLEEAYLKLRPMIRNHPRVGSWPVKGEQRCCPACGSYRSKSHDYRRTKSYEIHRKLCLNCGSTFEGSRKSL